MIKEENAKGALKVLKFAKKILSKGKHRWRKGSYAADASGFEISAHSDKAYSFCALGIMARATKKLGLSAGVHSQARVRLRDVVDSLYPYVSTAIWNWNDDPNTKYKSVLKGFDKAIENATSKLRKFAAKKVRLKDVKKAFTRNRRKLVNV